MAGFKKDYQPFFVSSYGMAVKWILEVEDECYNSTVLDDPFDTDQEALDEVLKTIREEGIWCLIGEPDSSD